MKLFFFDVVLVTARDVSTLTLTYIGFLAPTCPPLRPTPSMSTLRRWRGSAYVTASSTLVMMGFLWLWLELWVVLLDSGDGLELLVEVDVDGSLWFRCNTCSSISDHLALLADHLDLITWISLTSSPGSPRPHHLAHLDAVSCLISTTSDLSRPSQITLLGGRLFKRPLLFAIPSCLVGSNFPSFHSLPQRPAYAFRIWHWLPHV